MDDKKQKLAKRRKLHEQARPLNEKELWDELYNDEPCENIQDQEFIDEEDSEDEDDVLFNEAVPDEYTWQELQEEIENSEDAVNIEPTGDRAGFLGRNGFKWYSQPLVSKRTRTSSKNIVLHLPGPKGRAKDTKNLKEIWQLFFTDEILDIIVDSTNREIELRKLKYTTEQRYLQEINKTELMALFGLLYFAGVLKDAHLSLDDMWSEKFGVAIFRYTMTKNRFEFLLNCLRFDDKTTRAERKAGDKFAPIREIWNLFITNCKSNYTPYEYVTIDEQLLNFRGRCPFKMYLPSKPDKYGLKIIMMCDAKTYYMCSAIPYTGKDPNRNPQDGAIPTQYVMKLTTTIAGTNRNVTMDNWFSSVELARKLLENKLTMVGTLRKNKREIPIQFLDVKRKEVPSSAFAFSKDLTLVSHVSEKKKCVLLVSSMHFQDDVNLETKKPEITMFYNSTKGGVDTFDQLCHSKTVARKTRRWPLRILYGMLDAAGINSFVLHQFQMLDQGDTRSNFLKKLADVLVVDYMKQRSENKRLPRKLRQSIRDYLGYPDELPPQEPQNSSRRCYFCPRSRDRKGRHICVHCKKNMCAEHQFSICEDCKL